MVWGDHGRWTCCARGYVCQSASQDGERWGMNGRGGAGHGQLHSGPWVWAKSIGSFCSSWVALMCRQDWECLYSMVCWEMGEDGQGIRTVYMSSWSSGTFSASLHPPFLVNADIAPWSSGFMQIPQKILNASPRSPPTAGLFMAVPSQF